MDEILFFSEKVDRFLCMLSCAFLGAMALFVYNRMNNKQPFSVFRALNVDVSKKAKPLKIFSDMVISSVLGGLVMVVISDPNTTRQALAAGLGISGVFSVHAKPTGDDSSMRGGPGEGSDKDMDSGNNKSGHYISDVGKALCVLAIGLLFFLSYLPDHKFEIGVFIGIVFTIASAVLVYLKSKQDRKSTTHKSVVRT